MWFTRKMKSTWPTKYGVMHMERLYTHRHDAMLSNQHTATFSVFIHRWPSFVCVCVSLLLQVNALNAALAAFAVWLSIASQQQHFRQHTIWLLDNCECDPMNLWQSPIQMLNKPLTQSHVAAVKHKWNAVHSVHSRGKWI